MAGGFKCVENSLIAEGFLRYIFTAILQLKPGRTASAEPLPGYEPALHSAIVARAVNAGVVEDVASMARKRSALRWTSECFSPLYATGQPKAASQGVRQAAKSRARRLLEQKEK
jgi:hypothetical protein